MRPGGLSVVLLGVLANMGAAAASPQLYHQSAYQSPVRGAPDDLLLLAGGGFAEGDAVVYRAVTDTTIPPKTPDAVPARSNEDQGSASVVSYENVPNSLTILLPRVMQADRSYALWARNLRGEWSNPVMINDARPLWASPAYIFASEMPAFLPAN